MVKAGKLKLIALVSPQRHPSFTDLPLAAEHYPGASVESFFGIVVPRNTPREIVEQLGRDIATALKAPQVRQRIVDLGLVPLGTSPQQFDALIRAETRKWLDLIQRTNLKVE